MPELTTLLTRPVAAGFPTEYLLARLQGRRAGLLATGRPASGKHPPQLPGASRGLPAGGELLESPWERLWGEFRWAYGQMNERLRAIFAPFFLWYELRTVILCLRFRRGGERERSARLLTRSLLAEPIRRALTAESEPAVLLDALAEQLALLAEPLRTLGMVFRAEGEAAVEQRLVTLYLERVAGPPFDPLIREFFRALIDLRNLLSLAKTLRWRLTAPPLFVPGGSIGSERLERARTGGGENGADLLARSLPGMGRDSLSREDLESHLLGWLTRKVRTLGREPLGNGLVLDYLWRCSLEARGLGHLARRPGASPELLPGSVSP